MKEAPENSLSPSATCGDGKKPALRERGGGSSLDAGLPGFGTVTETPVA